MRGKAPRRGYDKGGGKGGTLTLSGNNADWSGGVSVTGALIAMRYAMGLIELTDEQKRIVRSL